MTNTKQSHRADWGRAVLGVEAVGLILLGGAGTIMSAQTPGPVTVLVFGLSLAHAVILLVTGVLAMAAVVTRRLVVPFAVVQLVVYGGLYLYGANQQNRSQPELLALNPADAWLHLGLAVVGLLIAVSVPTMARRRT